MEAAEECEANGSTEQHPPLVPPSQQSVHVWPDHVILLKPTVPTQREWVLPFFKVVEEIRFCQVLDEKTNKPCSHPGYSVRTGYGHLAAHLRSVHGLVREVAPAVTPSLAPPPEILPSLDVPLGPPALADPHDLVKKFGLSLTPKNQTTQNVMIDLLISPNQFVAQEHAPPRDEARPKSQAIRFLGATPALASWSRRLLGGNYKGDVDLFHLGPRALFEQESLHTSLNGTYWDEPPEQSERAKRRKQLDEEKGRQAKRFKADDQTDTSDGMAIGTLN